MNTIALIFWSKKENMKKENIPIDVPGPIEMTVVPLAFFSVRVVDEESNVLRAAGVGAELPDERGMLS